MKSLYILSAVFLCVLSLNVYASESLVLLMGGNGSCDESNKSLPMLDQANRLNQELLKHQYQVDMIASCYSLLEEKPYVMTDLSVNNPPVPLNHEEYLSLVTQRAKATKNQRINIVGHSYGGWLAIWLALRLPKEIQIQNLVTIDPISQTTCARTSFPIRVQMLFTFEETSPGCWEAPFLEFEKTEFERLKSHTGLWRNYFQRQSRHLRSGPIPVADFNYEYYLEDPEIAYGAHRAIKDEPLIWRRFYFDILAQPTVAASPKEKSWSLNESKEFYRHRSKFAFISDYSLRTTLRYQKSSLSLFPRNEDGRQRVQVFQPNATPMLGLSLFFSANHNIGFSYAEPYLEYKNRNAAKSKIHHLEYHYIRKKFGIDFSYRHYRGFFRDEVDQGDNRLFRDSIFLDAKDREQFKKMRLTAIGLDGIYIFRAEAYSLPAAMAQKEKISESGWSPGIAFSFNQVAFKNADNILPEGSDFQMRALSFYNLTAMPAFAYTLASSGYFFSGVLAWGYSYNLYEIDLIEKKENKELGASTGNLRGSIGYASNKFFIGLLGYKGIIDGLFRKEKGFSYAYSNAEFFVGMHF